MGRCNGAAANVISPAEVAVPPPSPGADIRRGGRAGVPPRAGASPPPVGSSPGRHHAGIGARHDTQRRQARAVEEETRDGRRGANVVVGLGREVTRRER